MAFINPVVEHWLEQEIVHESTMRDRSDDPLHHLQMLYQRANLTPEKNPLSEVEKCCKLSKQ